MKTINDSSTLRLLSLVFLLFLVGAAEPSPADTPSPSSTPGALYTTDFGSDPFATPEPRWWISNPTAITWVKDVVHGGKGSLKLSNSDKSKSLSAYGPYIPYTGPKLRLSAEVKSENLVTGIVNPSLKALIAIYYYDADKHEINMPWSRYHDIQNIPDGSQDWQTYDKTFDLPGSASGVAFARVSIFLPGSGTIWVDSISLIQRQ
jgi:hypothetical protein